MYRKKPGQFNLDKQIYNNLYRVLKGFNYEYFISTMEKFWRGRYYRSIWVTRAYCYTISA